MATQAFIYNAVIFTFSIVLTTFFKVSDSAAPAYLIPFGIANFAGALLLGRLFDTVGRRPMIAGTYFISAVGLFVLGLAVQQRHARARRLHDRPVRDVLLRLRGGVGRLPDGQRGLPAGDARHGHRALLRDLDRHRRRRRAAALRQPARDRRQGSLFLGYGIASALMLVAAIVAWVWGVDAEQESLEEIAEPLSATSAEAA